MLKEGANVQLLDKPTNDLDVNTLRRWRRRWRTHRLCGGGNHNCWFQDRICTHILAFECGNQARLLLGTWSNFKTHLRDTCEKD